MKDDLKLGELLLSTLGFTRAEIAARQAAAQAAPQQNSTKELRRFVRKRQPVWIQRRPARHLNPLRARIANCAQELFTPSDLGERRSRYFEVLFRRGELHRVRAGAPGKRPLWLSEGDVRLRRFEPLYKRTPVFWTHWGVIKAKLMR